MGAEGRSPIKRTIFFVGAGVGPNGSRGICSRPCTVLRIRQISGTSKAQVEATIVTMIEKAEWGYVALSFYLISSQ